MMGIQSLADLEQECENARLAAVAKLTGVVAGLPEPTTDCGFILGGSAALAESFTLSSDLDVNLIAPDVQRGEQVAANLEKAWRESGAGDIPMSISLFIQSPGQPDPYWRAALWLGPPSQTLRQLLCMELQQKSVRQAHLLEAYCEYLAVQGANMSGKSRNLRTQVDGLRFLWLLKFVSEVGLWSTPAQAHGWLPRQLAGCALTAEEIQTVEGRLRWIRAARFISTTDKVTDPNKPECRQMDIDIGATRETDHPLGGSPLVPVLEWVFQQRAEQLGVDLAGIHQLLGAGEEEKLRACQTGLSAAVGLAWCECSGQVLQAMAPLAMQYPLVAMGLAFNRATPADVVLSLLASCCGPRTRPLLRRRLYFHKALKTLPCSDWDELWMNQLSHEVSPHLRSALIRALQEIRQR
jgi:hypothetical protein